MLAAAEHPVQPHIRPGLDRSVPLRRYTDPYLRVFDLSSGSSLQREPSGPGGDFDVAGHSRLMGRTRRERTYASKRISASWFIPKSTPTVADRQEYWERPAGGIPECSRGGAVCCRIQLGMIPLGLNSMATISIFAHWPLALRAEAQHDKR